MKAVMTCLLLFIAAPSLMAQETLHLGNNAWPPFVIEGEEQGTSEQIVCEALRRAGWTCDIELGNWADMLQAANEGEKDGLIATWHTPERERTLRFSAAYLTNRMVPVIRNEFGVVIRSLADLAGMEVAMEVGAAYGDAVMAARSSFTVVDTQGVENAMRAVRDGEADVVLVDELIAREFVDGPEGEGLALGQHALSYRELYFVVSRQHPQSTQIIAAFNSAFQSMLKDGTVNRILDIEWVVTDLNYDGVLDFVHRGSASPVNPGDADSVYPLGQDAYQQIRQVDFDDSAVNYHVDSVVHETAEAAMNAVFKKEKKCHYDSLNARIVCVSK